MTALGAVQTVVICVAGTGGIQGACPTGQVETVTTAYLVSPTAATTLDLAMVPFDAATAAEFYVYGLIITITLYLIALSAGVIIRMVRSA